MIAYYESRIGKSQEKLWIGKFRNLKNIFHWHNEIEIVYIDEGSCVIETEAKTIQLCKNECAFLESGTIHRLIGAPNSIVTTLLIDPSILEPIINSHVLADIKIKTPDNLRAAISYISKELVHKRKFYSYCSQSAAIQLVAEIFRGEKLTQKKERQNKNSRFLLFKNIIKEIENNYQFISFESICEKFHYTPSHFSRLFSSLTGMTFSKYLNVLKTEKAISLLQSDEKRSITEISTTCGFDSIRTFNRVFKKLTDYTPKSLPKAYSLERYHLMAFPHSFDPTQKESQLLPLLGDEIV